MGSSANRKHKTRNWYYRHIKDPAVQAARRDGFRARSAYKLLEMNTRLKLIRPHDLILDLGSSPGGWSQAARQAGGSGVRIVALDLLEMAPLAGVEFLRGDFESAETLVSLSELLAGRKVDLILSDMAPEFIGIISADQVRSMALCQSVLRFAAQTLQSGGKLLMKTFVGEGFDALLKEARLTLKSVKIMKPSASRLDSREQYLFGIKP